MGYPRIDIVPRLAPRHRPALEQLLFFNSNQHRVRDGIEQSIETYGVPELFEDDDGLRPGVGRTAAVQTLFAVAAGGRPLGVAVFLRSAQQRFAVLHLGIDPRLERTP